MPENAPQDSLSFTFNDQDHVLALTRITDSGDLFTRKADHWVPVSDSDRAVYDRTMRDISPASYKEATDKFDADQINLTLNDVKDFLSAV